MGMVAILVMWLRPPGTNFRSPDPWRLHIKFGFICVLRPVKIISLILNRVNQSLGGVKPGDPREKLPDHPRAELGLSHMWPKRRSNPQQWDDERFSMLKISSLGHGGCHSPIRWAKIHRFAVIWTGNVFCVQNGLSGPKWETFTSYSRIICNSDNTFCVVGFGRHFTSTSCTMSENIGFKSSP